MPGGKGNIRPEDGKQFSSDYQPQERWTENAALKLGNDLVKWQTEKTEEGEDKGNIFFEDYLIIEMDLYPELISYLSDKFTSFLKLIGKAKKIQEIKLVKYGVADRLQPAITKFVLTNHHGYKDRTEVKQELEIIDNDGARDRLATAIGKITKPDTDSSSTG